MDKIVNWQAVSVVANRARIPVVVMVDQSDCPYCRKVENEYFSAILTNGELKNGALYGKISLDEGETITIEKNTRIDTQEFLAPYKTNLTPTVLFLAGSRRELVDKMVGLSTPDFYGYYLETAIRKAIDILNAEDFVTGSHSG